MGFLDTFRSWVGSTPKANLDELNAMWDRSILDESGVETPPADPAKMEAPVATTDYDREQWRKKLKRILNHLPRSQPEWDDLVQEAGALELGDEWVSTTFCVEFSLLIRKFVSDRVVTSEEHHTLDLARSLMGITDEEAESLLHAIVVEAESFFGGKIEGA